MVVAVLVDLNRINQMSLGTHGYLQNGNFVQQEQSETTAGAGIDPYFASQYYAWPSAASGIAMPRVDKFPHPRQQTRGN